MAMVLLRNKVPGSDIGRPQEHTMTQSSISLVLEIKVTGSVLESRWVR